MRGRLRPRRRADAGGAERLAPLLRFGLPTVPAEASVYALSVLDRQYIVHSHGTAAAGRYAIAIKIAGALVLIVLIVVSVALVRYVAGRGTLKGAS